MKKRLVIILLLIIILIVTIIGFASIIFFDNNIFDNSSSQDLTGCKIKKTRETPVPLELAKSIALDNLKKTDPDFEWIYVGNYLTYNSFDKPNYYVLIFRERGFTSLDTLNKLEENAKLFSDSTQEESEKKYQFNNIATVYTGAMKEDSLIIRHFRGIPESIGKKLEVKDFVENKYPGMTIGNLYYDSPMDVGYYEIINKDSKKASGNLIKVYDYSIVSHSDLIQNQERVQNGKEERYSRLNEKECEILRNGIAARESANRVNWDSY